MKIPKPTSEDAESSFEDAMRAAIEESEKLVADDPERAFDKSLPFNQFFANYCVDLERIRFEAGDKTAMLSAISRCASAEIVMPTWLSDAFINAYKQVASAHVKSWDDAFGKPFPKSTHLAAARRKLQDKYRVVDVFNKLVWRDPNRPIDVGLFEEIGAELGFKATRVSELYREVKASQPYLVKRISRKT